LHPPAHRSQSILAFELWTHSQAGLKDDSVRKKLQLKKNNNVMRHVNTVYHRAHKLRQLQLLPIKPRTQREN